MTKSTFATRVTRWTRRGQLTNTTATGLGMGGTLTFDQLEGVTINLGEHDDSFTIVSTHAGQSTINLNGGDDRIAIKSTSGLTTVHGGAGNDIFNVGSVATVAINTGGVADNIAADLAIDGGADADTTTIDDTADGTGDTGILTSGLLSGVFAVPGVQLSYSALETLNINLGRVPTSSIREHAQQSDHRRQYWAGRRYDQFGQHGWFGAPTRELEHQRHCRNAHA